MPSPELRFAHYRVLQRADGSPHQLGTGAMGVTYKAIDERLQLEVALKVISPTRLHEPSVQALFLREARAAARVRHTNVASVLALDDTPGQLFYAMEFVPGITLQSLLGMRRRLAPALAADLALQAARGLEAIHRQGLIHRDLKPANLMLVLAPEEEAEGSEDPQERWELKVIDFGLARALDSELLGTGGAPTQGFRGTALYASPEQCLERTELDGRSDLYSLGCIFCEMLAGRPPFLARSHHEIMAQHISAPVPPQALGRIPAVLHPILQSLLAKDPAARPASAGVFARQLERLLPQLADLPAAARTADLPPPEPSPSTYPGAAASDAVTVVQPPGSEARRSGSTVAEQRSIAVLALTNLSSDKENEYFSDGISEELLNALARIPGLRVAARTSSFYFKGRQVVPTEVARQLSVAYLVDGSVRRAGDRVRISVQLISATDGFPIWSDTFERELRDVFAVQDEIARIVAENLKLRLSSVANEARAAVDPEAFRLYLQGRQCLHFRSQESTQQGEALFRHAIRLDPQFGRAMAALAYLLVLRADVGFLQDGSWEKASILRTQADRLAEEALVLDPAEADALGARGMSAWSAGNMLEAIRLIRAALALNPSSANNHHLLSRALAGNGELEESVRHIRQALTLDPLSPRIIDNCSLMLHFAGHSEESLQLAERGLAAIPLDPQMTAWKAAALEELGRTAEAVAAAREVVRGGGTWVFYIACGILLRAGLAKEAGAAARQAEAGPVMSHAFCLAALGQAERAVALIPEKLGAMFFEELIYPSMWDAVRDTPAYQRVMARHGLTEAHTRARARRGL